MQIYQYKCVLLTDVVIASSTATEGYSASLNYIPGAKFLGIVANALYTPDDAQKTLDLFHNGVVRYGDAHPEIDNQYGLPIPFAWYYEKGKDVPSNIYLHHRITAADQRNLAGKGVQLRQLRNGYFTEKGKWVKRIDQAFSIKSAYDPELRRASEGQMYGYFALPRATTWVFTVEDDTGKYAEEIKQILQGRHRVGRSRSAEYGLVDIAFDKSIPAPAKVFVEEEVVLYAKSNLLFYDQYCQPTTRPDPQMHFGLPTSTTIDWSNSQVRTRLYQTWNRKRFNRDADRLIIEKGSVFVCNLQERCELQQEMQVGSQLSEGFGKIQVNPSFLLSSSEKLPISLTAVDMQLRPHAYSAAEVGEDDSLVLDILRSRNKSKDTEVDIDRVVNEFVKKYHNEFKGISSSQWGMVRNYAKHAGNVESFEKLLFSDGVGCLNRGQSEKDWRKNDRRDTLHRFLFESKLVPKSSIIPLAIKLFAEMAKDKKNGHEE